MKKLVTMLVCFSFVVGCSTTPSTKFSYLPDYVKLEDKVPTPVKIPSNATSFDPIPLDEGYWKSKDGSKMQTINIGVLYSERDTALAIQDRSEAKYYKEVFGISEGMRKSFYEKSIDAEKLYQKRIEELRPGWWDENKLYVGFAGGLVGSVLLIWASSYLHR